MIRRTAFKCAALLLLALACSNGSAQDKTLTVRSIADAPSFAKRALVIGVGQYEHAGSLAPVTYNDAVNFAQLLKAQFKFPDEAITLLTDAPGTAAKDQPTYIHLRNAFNTLLASVNEKSEVIVYFSGHGTRAENHDWLVPMDGLPSDVNATCINYDEFRGELSTKTPARALLIVDACRNLSGGKDAGSSGFGASKGPSGPQFAELLSCRPKEESKVGKPEDFAESVFTHFLLRGLRGDKDAQANGVVTFDSLAEYLQGTVSQYVSNKYGEPQNPIGLASQGRMVLARPPRDVVAGQSDTVRPQLNPRPSAQVVAITRVNPRDGAKMVFIPGGTFSMGGNQARIDTILKDHPNFPRESFTSQLPQHTVSVTGFWIYDSPVTVAMFRKFTVVQHLAYDWRANEPAFGWHDDRPMVKVSWADAKAYCTWAGVSLPTEAQFERAARGPEGFDYPWGNTFDGSMCANSVAPKVLAGTASVRSFPANGFGLYDMTGNVAQWCEDWYDGNYYRHSQVQDPVNLTVGKLRALRAAPWGGEFPDMFCASVRFGIEPTYKDKDIGFRCASRE